MDAPEQEVLLQRYVDGDLDSAAQQRVKERLATDPAFRAELAALERLHTLMVDSAEYQALQLDSDALFSRISAATVAETVATSEPRPASRSLLERLIHGFWMPAGSVLAVAAAVLLTIYLPVDNTALERESNPPTGERAKPAAISAPAAAPASPLESQGASAVMPSLSSEVVQVDFGDNAGTVFDIALTGGASTAVVWINDEEE